MFAFAGQSGTSNISLDTTVISEGCVLLIYCLLTHNVWRFVHTAETRKESEYWSKYHSKK